MIRIRSKPINDIMIIPHIHHGNLTIRHAKHALAKPHGIPIQKELLQLLLHLRRERSVVLVMRVTALGPLAKVTRLHCCSVHVDLVSTTEHHVEWTCLVGIEYVSP